MRIETVSLEDIDLKDFTCKFTNTPDVEALALSIAAVGLLQPPLLRCLDGQLQVIAGFRRIAALAALGKEQFKAAVFDDLSLADAFEIALRDNRSTRDFTLLEKASAVAKIEAVGLAKEILITRFMPLLGLPPSRQLCDDLLWVDGLTDKEKLVVVDRGMQLRELDVFKGLEIGLRAQVMDLLGRLKLGLNRRREVTAFLIELSRNTGQGIREILNEPKLALALKRCDAASFRRELRARRYPEFTAITKAIARHRSALSLPKEIRLEIPPYLEGEYLMLSLRTDRLSDLAEAGALFVELSSNHHLKEILRLLHGLDEDDFSR